MAARFPSKSSSGRNLRPSTRLKEHMVMQIGGIYDSLIGKLTKDSKEIMYAVEHEFPIHFIENLKSSWVTIYVELREAEEELRRYLPREQIEEHDKAFRADLDYFALIRETFEEHLRVRDKRRPPEDDDDLESETTQLEERIKVLERDLNKTRRQLGSVHLSPGDAARPTNEDDVTPRPNRIEEWSQRTPVNPVKKENVTHVQSVDDPMAYRNYPDYQIPNLPTPDQHARTPGATHTEPDRFFDQYTQPTQIYQSRSNFTTDRITPRMTHMRTHHQYESTPLARDYLPRRSTDDRGGQDSTTAALNRLADLLTNKKGQSLPKMEPTVFKGDIMKFPSWMSSFETLVERKYDSPGERLFYLGKYTDGEAREVISGFLDYTSGDAYIRAKMLLITRFGDKLKISESYKKRLQDWPLMKPGDRAMLQKFSDFLWQCHKAMSTIEYLNSLDTPEENRKLLKKLPFFIVDRWNRVIDMWVYSNPPDNSEMIYTQSGPFPPFVEFCRFMANEARIANGPCSQPQSASGTHSNDTSNRDGGSKKNFKKSTTLATNASVDKKAAPPKPKATGNAERGGDQGQSNDDGPRPIRCMFCSEAHFLSQCDAFLNHTSEFKKKFSMEKGMCFGCLRRGHTYKTCRIRRPELMKEPENPTPTPEDRPATVLATKTEMGGGLSTMIVPVMVSSDENPEEKLTLAVIDNQSDSCFASDEFAERLGVSQEAVTLKLVTMGTTRVVKSRMLSNLKVRGLGETESLQITKCFTEQTIPTSRSRIPDPAKVRSWKHLEGVADKLYAASDDLEIGLLIGYDCSDALIGEEYVRGARGQPFGVKTLLGWSVIGKVGDEVDEESCCMITSVREITAPKIKKIFDLEFEPEPDETMISREDKRFLQCMKETIVHRNDKHFETELPLKTEKVQLPNNKPAAVKRLQGLKKKLKNDEVYGERYKKFIDDMVASGQARILEEDESDEEGMIWYIPHLGVYHARKPEKLRVVFDASALYKLRCLNDVLLSGPDQTNKLIGVLVRFRGERVVLICDVEGMFHQVRVAPKHQNLMRFVWYRDGNPDNEMITYCMEVHFFGATSSPGCANYAFKEVARKFGEEYGEVTMNFILKNFYVDDGLISLKTEDEVIDLVFSSHGLCEQGGFKLHKYISNSKSVLSQIPPALRAKNVVEWKITDDSLPVEVTLGMTLDLEDDCFRFDVKLAEKPPTRRGMLSGLSEIYDPLGLISPVILQGRILMKKLCKEKFEWDEIVSEIIQKEWFEWYNQLAELRDLRIKRCYKNSVQDEIKKTELHVFSDASFQGYGVAAYVKITDADDVTDTCLVMAKARVGPSRPATIPRLELQAAVLAVKIGKFLNEEMPYHLDSINYWTDSKVVLGYIQNASRRFHVYVQNRVQTIVESSEVADWNYVKTDQNPADISSRGMLVKDLKQANIWWHGPEMMLMNHDEESRLHFEIEDGDPEIKVEKTILSIEVKPDRFLEPLLKISSWRKMKMVVAACRRYAELLKTPLEKRKNRTLARECLSVNEIDDAGRMILIKLQETEFPEVRDALKIAGKYPSSTVEIKKRNTILKRYTNLYRLDIYLAEDGLIRIGGRLRRGDFPAEFVHPVLLPKAHDIVDAIIRDTHERHAHPGRDTTLGNLHHEGIWIVNGRSSVDRVLRECVTCRKLRGNFLEQRMADLPKSRLEQDPPFSCSGMDVFGPFEVRQGRSMKKRWLIIFVCMACRAVHVEVLYTMDTSSFICAFRRFVARRGPVRTLYSDRGSNFIGGRNELQNALNEMGFEDVKKELVKERCDLVTFDFNFPKSSHMGGAWERMIRSFRNAFSALLIQHSRILDDEGLVTLVAETEVTANGRPITYAGMTADVHEAPLTPLQILTLKPKLLPPPGDFVKEDIYCKMRWRRVQYLADQFWSRWMREFLPNLNNRRKWNEAKENVEVDDVVLMKDEALGRNQWPLGRITHVFPGEDGLVRKVQVKTAVSSYERPVHKLVFLFRPTKVSDA